MPRGSEVSGRSRGADAARRHHAGSGERRLLLAAAIMLVSGAVAEQAGAGTYSFAGHVFSGQPFDTTTPVAGVAVNLWGDDDEWPENGPRTLLAGGMTNASGGYSLSWEGSAGSYVYLHVIEEDPAGTFSTGARAESPGTVRNYNCVSYSLRALDPGTTYAGIDFWDVPQATPTPMVLSGRVYEGDVGIETTPLAGVSVALYGANSAYPATGTLLASTSTDASGWYGLTVSGSFERYHITENDPAGYVSAGATSVSGVVRGANWIEYASPLGGQTLTGNKFWDKKQVPPTPTPSPTATPGPTPSPTPTALPTPTPTPTGTATPTPTVTPTPTPTPTTAITRTLCAVADAYVSESSPQANHGWEEDLVAGFGGGTNEHFATRTLVRFDLGLPSGSTVVSAAFQLSQTHVADSGRITLSVLAVNEDWEESTVTWANQPATETTAVAHVSVGDAVPQTVSWDVTDLAQEWADGTTPNHGLLVRGPETALFNWRRTFDSRHSMPVCPSLVLTVDVAGAWPTPTPTPEPTPTPTPTPLCPDPDMAGDNAASAADITPFTDVTETICGNGDEDWWKFSVTKNQGIRVVLADTPDDYGVYLRKPDGSEAGHSWKTGQNDAVAAQADVAGDWYAQVVGMGHWGLDPYTLRVEVCGRPDEAGDSFEAATELVTEVQQGGFICPVGDVDWYEFTVGDNQSVSITATLADPPFAAELSLYYPSGQLVTSRHGTPGGGDLILHAKADDDPGEWRVKIAGLGNGWDADSPYSLVVSLDTDLDLTIAGLDIVQSAGIAGYPTLVLGKPTMVRAYVDIGDARGPIDDVEVKLWGWKNCTGCTALSGSPLKTGLKSVSKTSLAAQRASLDKSFNFTLPSAWNTQGDIYLQAEVNPGLAIPESTYANNTADLLATFEWRAPVNIALAGLRWGSYETSLTNNADLARAIAWFKAVMPLGQITWYTQTDGPLEGDWDLTTGGAGCGDGWADLLDDLADLYESWDNRPANAFLYGVLPPNMPYHYPGCGCVGKPVAGGVPNGTSLAHEVGHNMGLLHAPSDRDDGGAVNNEACGDPGTSTENTSYPYYLNPQGGYYRRASIGKFGVNVAAANCWASSCGNPKLFNPANAYDFMSYCRPVWISPYTFEKLRTFPSFAVAPADAGSTPAPHLVVSGRVHSGEIELPRPFWLASFPAGEYAGPGSGPYSIELQDAAGNVLFARHFDLADPYHVNAADSGVFREIMPLAATVTRVVFRRNGVVVRQVAASAGQPSVSVVAPNGGESWNGAGPYEVRWRASDPDGDPLTAKLDYSIDGGATWRPRARNLTGDSFLEDHVASLSGSAKALVRVTVTDGFWTASDVSDGTFQIPAKPPAVLILSPPDGSLLAEGVPLVAEGLAIDPEDGPLDSSSLSWSSDLSGSLGTGESVIVAEVPCGAQTITLQAVDSNGQIGTAASSVTTCCFTIAPEGISFAAAGGRASFDVTPAAPVCPWEATSDASWLQITAGASGAGNGTVEYTVLPNPDRRARKGRITVGNTVFSVFQAGQLPRVRRHFREAR
jgi:hypothetical protein